VTCLRLARSPTILQIIPRLDTGGAELSTIEITDAIVRGGGRAIVATAGGRMAERIIALGGELARMRADSKNPVRMLANARALARLITVEKVDLVHARSRAPAWSALLASRLGGKPFVTTYHGAYAERGALKRLYNGVMARGDIVITNSRFTADLVRQRYGTREDRVRVIHRGVDATAFDPERVDAARVDAMRQRLGVATGQRVILQAARLTGWKGQRVLIEAAHRLAAAGELGNAAVILAGDAQGRGDYEASLRLQIARLGLEGTVRLVGHVDDVAAALALTHVAIIASTEPEAFGRSVTEAAAMRCPVVATDHGAPPEIVLDAGRAGFEKATGWLVAPGDAAALASSLAAALALSDADRQAMGDRARAHATVNFSLFAMKHASLGAYDSLLGSNLATAFSQSL